MSGKGDNRRPEAVKGAFDRGYEQIQWPKKVYHEITDAEGKAARSGRDRRKRTDRGREGDARDASAGNLVR